MVWIMEKLTMTKVANSYSWSTNRIC